MSQDMLKGGKKDCSRRRFLGSGPRPDKKVARKLQEEARLAVWQEKTAAQQLQALDLRLGDGVGAKKQRARLQALIEAKAQEKAAAKEETPKEKKTKKEKMHAAG